MNKTDVVATNDYLIIPNQFDGGQTGLVIPNAIKFPDEKPFVAHLNFQDNVVDSLDSVK